jgi:predicted RecA/RadA family phage recombinase
MKNQSKTGTPTGRRFALCPTTVLAGDPVLVGAEPAVALNDYQSITGGTVFLFDGSFFLSVLGATVISPLSGLAMKPGDKVFADGGTLDSVTNVKTGFTLDANTGGTLFGKIDLDDAGVGSGLTALPSVLIGAQ